MRETAETSPTPGVIYLAEMDHQRQSRLSPYRVSNSGLSFVEIARRANESYFSAFQPGYEGAEAGRLAVDPILRYEKLLRALMTLPNAAFVTAAELVGRTPKGDELLIQIRHDVDGDVMAALAQAEVEARLGITSTNYILHTAPYYGAWNSEKKVFERHESSLAVYQRMQALGHEIALHTDSLYLYQTHGVDGAAAICEELAWLRAAGLNITGTVSHNSISTYGACNYAIFRGRPVGRIQDAPAGPRGVVFNGQWAPLQVLDESELGLAYEGNELFWQNRMLLEYFCLMSQNSWYHIAWENGDSKPNATPSARADEWMTQERVVDYIREMKRPSAVMLSVHCMHYGLRPSGEATPIVPATRFAPEWQRSKLGWRTHPPRSLVAAAGGAAHAPDYQSFIVANNQGMLDVPAEGDGSSGERILFLGRENVHAVSICVNSKISQALVRIAKNRRNYTLQATSLAGPSVNSAILAAWYENLRAKTAMAWDTVFLAVGIDDIVLSNASAFANLWNVDATSAARFCPQALTGEALHTLSLEPPPDLSCPRMEIYKTAKAADLLADPPPADAGAAWEQAAERLSQAIELLKRSSKHVVLLLEDCGEKAGLWTLDSPLAERCRLARRADALFGRLAGQHGVGFVNPYHAFNGYQGSAATHWPDVNQWSIHGHALAAEACFKHIFDRGAIWMEPLKAQRNQIKQQYEAADLLTDFSVYREFIEGLQADSRFELLPMRDFKLGPAPDRVRIHFRHGVYSDPIGAVVLGDYLKSRGLVASFYLLQTSQYYGQFFEGAFHHGDEIEHIVARLRSSGQEIGLQIDPLHIYQDLKLDGTGAMLSELSWLRSRGVDVQGVVANGSATQYGAENFEIFKGFAAGGRKSVECRGTTSPLQTMSLAEAGLTYVGDLPAPFSPIEAYEGQQAIQGFHGTPVHLASLAGRDSWILSHQSKWGPKKPDISTSELLAYLKKLELGKQAVIIAYPEYFANC